MLLHWHTMWSLEDNLQELVHSFHCVNSGFWIPNSEHMFWWQTPLLDELSHCHHCVIFIAFLFIVLGGMHAIAYIWWSEDNLRWLILSFHHMDTRDWTQGIRFGGKNLYLCYLAYPIVLIFTNCCLFVPHSMQGRSTVTIMMFLLFFKIKEFKILCVWMFCMYVCLYVYFVWAWYPQKSEVGIKSPGTGV